MSFLVIIKRPKLPVALSQNNLLKLSVFESWSDHFQLGSVVCGKHYSNRRRPKYLQAVTFIWGYFQLWINASGPEDAVILKQMCTVEINTVVIKIYTVSTQHNILFFLNCFGLVTSCNHYTNL